MINVMEEERKRDVKRRRRAAEWKDWWWFGCRIVSGCVWRTKSDYEKEKGGLHLRESKLLLP